MWVSEHVGVNEVAERNRVSIYWNGPTEEGDVEQQVSLVERAIHNDNFGLILTPGNPFALNTEVQRALKGGMSVVIVGSPLSLKPEKRMSFVLNDEQKTGLLAAQRLKRALKHGGQILIIGTDPVSSEFADRSGALESVLARESPDIEVVDRLKGLFSFGQAELATEKAILAHPHLSAILSLNVTTTRGAVAAVRTAGPSNHILIVGCDYNLSLLFLLRQGVVDSLIAPNMRAMGAMAVNSIIQEDRGGTVPSYTFVSPVLITKENIDDEAIQQMLYQDWRVRQ